MKKLNNRATILSRTLNIIIFPYIMMLSVRLTIFCQTCLIYPSNFSNSIGGRGEASPSYNIQKELIMIDKIPDLPNEEWREIEGYSGKYLVSNQGRIKSLKYAKPRLLTAFVNNKGYARVALCKNG